MIEPTDIAIAKWIFGAIGFFLCLLVLWHLRESRGNKQLARYKVEQQLQHEDRTAWQGAVDVLRGDLGGRLSRLEEQVKHMPTGTDFAELRGDVREVVTRQNGIDEHYRQIRTTLHRIEDYLMKGKRS